ncbi:glycosyltransferase family 2 protein [Pseudopelagicola sp. nBUS_19]|uniref:glycosyltransferase family 2 protein n=1 Tax=Pseudopelagicola sp. nBUS_19 TaxID=3395316 RepID=UPI003EB8CE58
MKKKLYSCAHYVWSQYNRKIGEQVHRAIADVAADIPCFVVCYNNHTYVRQMVDQLNKLNLTPIIFDNASTDEETKALLKKLHQKNAHIIEVGRNLRHKVGFRPGIYEAMPERFAYTDPDIKFGEAMADNFLDVLHGLTEEYGIFKAGLALSVTAGRINSDMQRHYNVRKSIPFSASYSITEFEKAHWRFPLKNRDGLEVYFAATDTTFAVYNKTKFRGEFMEGVRLAGNFSAIHLPWFPELDQMNLVDKENYMKTSKSSSWKN